MIIVFIQLLFIRSITTAETSSFLTNVLTKIQRERLGLLDDEIDKFNNQDLNVENSDYIYVNGAGDTDSPSVPFKSNYYSSVESLNKETDDKYGQESNDNSVRFTGEYTSLPNDAIYIYNDTIYLYKAPNVTHNGPTTNTASYSSGGLASFDIIPFKTKGKHPPMASLDIEDALDVESSDPEDLIKVVINEEEDNPGAGATPSSGTEEDAEGYYYYYYPIDQVPPELAEAVTNMLAKPGKIIKPGVLPKPGKMPLMPGMPTKMIMMKKPKQPVGPLFKAMAIFVGTAVMFIVSILLLPRVKLVKAKSSVFSMDDFLESTGLTNQMLSWEFDGKNKKKRYSD